MMNQKPVRAWAIALKSTGAICNWINGYGRHQLNIYELEADAKESSIINEVTKIIQVEIRPVGRKR